MKSKEEIERPSSSSGGAGCLAATRFLGILVGVGVLGRSALVIDPYLATAVVLGGTGYALYDLVTGSRPRPREPEQERPRLELRDDRQEERQEEQPTQDEKKPPPNNRREEELLQKEREKRERLLKEQEESQKRLQKEKEEEEKERLQKKQREEQERLEKEKEESERLLKEQKEEQKRKEKLERERQEKLEREKKQKEKLEREEEVRKSQVQKQESKLQSRVKTLSEMVEGKSCANPEGATEEDALPLDKMREEIRQKLKATPSLEGCNIIESDTKALKVKVGEVWERVKKRAQEERLKKQQELKQEQEEKLRFEEEQLRQQEILDAEEWRLIKEKAEVALQEAGPRLKKISMLDTVGVQQTGVEKAIEALTSLLKLTGLPKPNQMSEAKSLSLSILSWCKNVADLVLTHDTLLTDLKKAAEVKGNRELNLAVSRFLWLILSLDVKMSDVDEAYEVLLSQKGPWTYERKAVEKKRELIERVRSLGFKDGREEYVCKLLKAEALIVLCENRVEPTTIEVLLSAIGTTTTVENVCEAIKVFQKDEILSSYALEFLPCRKTTAVNLAKLVGRKQVSLTRGTLNPTFEYVCHTHRMKEAERSLDVHWNGWPLSIPLTFWGVIHIHYHCKTVAEPDLNTYYHVKENNFTASLGEEITDDATKRLADKK